MQIDKRELAENNVFFCDTCTRGFKTDEKFQEHVAGHEEVRITCATFHATPHMTAMRSTKK